MGNISRENAKLAINKIKDEAKTQIIKKRDEIKKKINLMRLRSDRKKAAIKSRIMSMRTDTAQQLSLYSKKGNMEKCFVPNPSKEDDIKILRYIVQLISLLKCHNLWNVKFLNLSVTLAVKENLDLCN